MLLFILLLVDYILILAAVGSWTYNVVTKQKQRPRRFVPAAAVFRKHQDITIDAQKVLLKALVEAQKKQIDTTKLSY